MLPHPNGRQARLLTELKLAQRGGELIQWSGRVQVIEAAVQSINKGELNKPLANRNTVSAAAKKNVIKQWGDGLRCDLKLYARIKGRDVLWAQSGGNTE